MLHKSKSICNKFYPHVLSTFIFSYAHTYCTLTIYIYVVIILADFTI